MQKLRQHDEDGGRTRVAAPCQIAPPALARNAELGLVQQLVDNRDEALRRVVAEKVVYAAFGNPALVGKGCIFVNADIEQVRQQANVLAQCQSACGLGITPGGEVQMACATIGRQAQLHAHGIVAGKAALVRPLELEAQSVGLGQGLGAAQQHGARTVGQHPAQKVGVKVGVIALCCKARTLEKARRHFAGHRQGQRMGAAFHGHGSGLHGAHTGGADPVHGQRFHGRGGHLALNHAGKAGHQRITPRRAAGQKADITELLASQSQGLLDRSGCHAGVAEHRLAFAIDGVVAGLNAVLGQDAALDALGDAVQRCDKRIHASIVHWGAGQKHAGRLQIDVGIGNRHRSSTGFYFTASVGICGLVLAAGQTRPNTNTRPI
ncbi:hypothetical protein SDC9_118646 [bioreactor metagenome]|uniref:Uncharacterized protein n=1 Tax=bioreactor metagenome TaxID=1076179 RepID=A0A645C1J4_9ZZZZ